MGTGPARITAADFLTPPEFRHLRLAGNEAGRVGGVRLELVAGGGGRTWLGACYQQVPLRVLPPFQFDDRQPALLYLLNPTAGLMDGDAQLVEVVVRTGARVLLVGQSATRIHPALAGYSTQQWRIRVEPGALLVMLPGPAIPFQGCRYYQRVEADLEPGAGFLCGDIWLAGRYERGAASERFRFETMVQELLVRRGERLVFRDRFCWRGPWDGATAAWHFASAPTWASLFATGPVGEHLATSGVGFRSGRFPTAAGDTCLRWGGSSECVTSCVVRTALLLASVRLGLGESHPLLFAEHLAPAHWFSTGHED